MRDSLKGEHRAHNSDDAGSTPAPATVSITVAIPHLPEREEMLQRALRSVEDQTLQPDEVIILTDHRREGAWVTRNRMLERIKTTRVAWLDDDDEFLPHHLATLYRFNADVVHSDYEVVNGGDHRPSFIQVTYLAMVHSLRAVGGFPEPWSDTWPYKFEDWGLLARLLRDGYTFRKVHQTTWRYHIHAHNTVGVGLDIQPKGTLGRR